MATEQVELPSVSSAAFIADKNQSGNPPPTLSCSEAMCVIGSTQSLPSTIALASPVLLRKRKNLTGRPPAAPDHYGGGDGAEPTGVPVFNPFSSRSTRKPQAMASTNFSAEHSLPSRGAMQSNQHPVKEPEEDSSGWAGRPQAARCAFMRLISPGFRSLRAILRS
jgi:hypothetical protein